MKIKIILAATGVLFFMASCKKDNVNPNPNPTPPSPPATVDKIKDSVLLYARDIYLWNTQIPANFNAQSYADPNKIMEAIRAYSIEPGFSGPVDRWSFAVKQSEWDNVSSGISKDFGFNIFFRSNTTDDLRVRFVEAASPAGKAGIKRGWRITKINGNANITTSNADFIVKGIYGSSSSPATTVSISFLKPDGNTADINLVADSYQEHPVFLDTVYTVAGKKAGYMVFNSFLGDTTEIYNRFSQTFTKFAQQNVDDVIIDLRYNGGGYVSVHDKLANYLAPTAANGQTLMTQAFNTIYAQYNSSTKINKIGSLNLPRVFMIVSSSSASASELLINNLKPFMEVILVGPSRTFGKPVGYFPIPVGDWYIFPVSFRSTNKSGQGNYFDGFALNSQVADGIDKDWGDITETSLASALKYIGTGGFRANMEPRTVRFEADPEVIKANIILDQPSFKGMVDKRPF